MSAPEWGLLLVADAPVQSLGAPGEVAREILRRLAGIALPDVGDAEVRVISESGALWAAEFGLIEEEDLTYLSPPKAGEADALDRRSLLAGARDWLRPGTVHAFRVADLLDTEKAGEMGLEAGTLALAVSTGSEDLGRLVLAGHRQRILAGIADELFDAPENLPAVPADTGETRELVADLFAATYSAANYAAARAALVVYALRRALGEAVGALHLWAAWPVGGLEEREETILHRSGLATVGAGEVLVSGQSIASGTGGMMGSAPPFGGAEQDGRWPWEEAGILQRFALLDRL